MKLPRYNWTPPEIDRLRTLWAAGWTASTIACDLGPHRTRNSVFSKVRRLGLQERGSPSIPKAPPR